MSKTSLKTHKSKKLSDKHKTTKKNKRVVRKKKSTKSNQSSKKKRKSKKRSKSVKKKSSKSSKKKSRKSNKKNDLIRLYGGSSRCGSNHVLVPGITINSSMASVESLYLEDQMALLGKREVLKKENHPRHN